MCLASALWTQRIKSIEQSPSLSFRTQLGNYPRKLGLEVTMDSEQQGAGFSISNLLGFDRRTDLHDKSEQQNLSEKPGEFQCTLSTFTPLGVSVLVR